MKNFTNEYILREEAGDGDGSAGTSDDAGTSDGGSGDGGSGSGGDGSGGDGGSGEPNWYASNPDDWRNQIAGDDEGKLKKLERYTDLNSFMDSSFDAHTTIRNGELSTGLPENPTEDQLNEFRTAHDIPVDGKYDLTMPEGVKLPDDDRAVVEQIMSIAHKGNVDQATFNAQVVGFIQARDAQVDKIIEQDGIETVQREQSLRDEWKGDYANNMTAVDNLLNRMLPEDLQETFRQSRGADGKGLLNNPAVMIMLANIERTINPMSTIPGAQENINKTARDTVDKAKALFKKGDRESMKAYNAMSKQYETSISYLQSIGETI